MTSSTWDASDDGGWTLSNGNLTATSPDNNTPGNIFLCYGSPAIPTHAKAYFEFTVTGAAVQTAFSVGFAVHGANVSNKNLMAEGETIPYSQFVAFSYNLGISNNGDVIYDPQHNATRTAAQGPAPNQWRNGSVIGVLLDRVDNTVEFTLNGVPQGGAFDISGIGDQTVYPMTFSWFRSGPVAVINGGTKSFAESIPTGFTALDNLTGTITPPSPPAAVTIGSGSDTLALQISEDAWQGNAQFTVSVDGQQVGGTQTALASHAAGQTQTFDVLGTFATGNHTATVNFLNDAYGGTSTEDRNLYVTGATIDSSVVSAAVLSERVAGPQSFSFLAPGAPGAGPPSVTIGSGSDTLALRISEDAWRGNAQFTVLVDGKQIGGTQTAVASHAATQSQIFNVLGTFGAGNHIATVNFLNDAYGGSPATDRNLYVTGATIDNAVIPGAMLSERVAGSQSFSFMGSDA
jgi:hypothetical protein